ncbi:MAG: hypothetical protein CM1200mP9_04640 [Gammaproteobacteria bacterium]|nr:MAG: hypothetical protein CM1200mP9_04640 [Gammaproteobacteria bacterium]
MTAASLTTAVVFLPFQLVDFDSEQMRSMILVVSMAILLPFLASLGVAGGFWGPCSRNVCRHRQWFEICPFVENGEP